MNTDKYQKTGYSNCVGQCPECKELITVLKDGTLKLHLAHQDGKSEYCEGWPNRIRRIPVEGTIRERSKEDIEHLKFIRDQNDDARVRRDKRRWAEYKQSIPDPFYAKKKSV